MSTFDSSSQKVGRALNVDTTVALMNSLACHAETASHVGAPDTSATTTFVMGASKTASYSADEMLLIFANLYFSISDGAASTGRFGIFINGAQLGADYVLVTPISSLAGNLGYENIVHWASGYSGSVTVDVRFSRNTGGGTVYSSSSEINVLALKFRPS